MDVKQKALEIVQNYYPIVNGGEPHNHVLKKAKLCANLFVDGIIKEYEDKICRGGYDYDWDTWDEYKNEWLEVKEEIESL